jgi:hypothetical protein
MTATTPFSTADVSSALVHPDFQGIANNDSLPSALDSHQICCLGWVTTKRPRAYAITRHHRRWRLALRPENIRGVHSQTALGKDNASTDDKSASRF